MLIRHILCGALIALAGLSVPLASPKAPCDVSVGELTEAQVTAVNRYLKGQKGPTLVQCGSKQLCIGEVDGLSLLSEVEGARYLILTVDYGRRKSFHTIAVDEAGRLFHPTAALGFGRMAEAFGVRIDSEQAAERLARDYLRFIYWTNVQFLESFDDIPWGKSSLEQEVERLDLELHLPLEPASTVKVEGGYRVVGTGWEKRSGRVIEIDLLVATSGKIEDRCQRFAPRVGLWGGDDGGVPLDVGPGAETLERLSASPELRARRLAARYLAKRFRTPSNGMEWIVGDETAELEAVALHLSEDPDRKVQKAAKRALRALQRR